MINHRGTPLGVLILAAFSLAAFANLTCGRADGKTWGNPLKPKVPSLLWTDLEKLNVKTGRASGKLRGLDGKEVRIPGFAVPLEDDMEYMSEFLLVPYPQACVHVPAPPPNQIVHVKMAPGKSIKTDWWNPIWVRGRLKITGSRSALAEASFRMEGISTEDYKPKDGGGNYDTPPPDSSVYYDFQ